MSRARARRVRRAVRVMQPRNRANLLRIADDRVARELGDWVLAALLALAAVAIPWVLGHVALAMGAMS